MSKHNVTRGTKVMLLAGVLASSTLVMTVGAQSPAPTGQPGHADAKRYQPDRFAGRAGKYYELIDPRAQVKLVVPSLEKVGQLRQSSTPQAGKSYWMAFSNKGRLVKRGDRVSVVIGRFRADGLVVD